MPWHLLSLTEARPFALHLLLIILSIIVTLWLACTNRVYNLDHRRPHFIDIEGEQRTASIQTTNLLQSDVTTAFSVLASATGAAAGWWASNLLWHCTVMFMEKSEITLAGFSKITSGGITSMLSCHDVSSRKNWFLIYAVIFICFMMNYSSAILTGSVTWQSTFTLVDGVVPFVNLTEGIPGSDLSGYRSGALPVTQAISLATSLATVTWGVNTPTSGLPSEPTLNLTRRAIMPFSGVESVQSLPPNSTIGTIQLPYFKVEKFEYIADPESVLTPQQWSLFNDSSPYNPYLLGGLIGLIPDASWGPGSSLTLPPPVDMLNFQILGIIVQKSTTPSCRSLADPSVPIKPYLTSVINPPLYSCLLFINMTYTAGSAICSDCKIVSPVVVQGNISNIQPIPDPITTEALAITPAIMSLINFNPFVVANGSTLQDIVVGSISLAYQCAWSSLVVLIGDIGPHNQTSIKIAIPASHPRLLRWRVYTWLALHIVALLGGIAFFSLEKRFRHPWVSDPMTAAFLLDTTAIFNGGEVTDSNTRDSWQPDAPYPAGKLKLNNYDPSRPGKPGTVVLIPTPAQGAPHSSHTQLEGESDQPVVLIPTPSQGTPHSNHTELEAESDSKSE